jgi:hypothetical protein
MVISRIAIDGAARVKTNVGVAVDDTGRPPGDDSVACRVSAN